MMTDFIAPQGIQRHQTRALIIAGWSKSDSFLNLEGTSWAHATHN